MPYSTFSLRWKFFFTFPIRYPDHTRIEIRNENPPCIRNEPVEYLTRKSYYSTENDIIPNNNIFALFYQSSHLQKRNLSILDRIPHTTALAPCADKVQIQNLLPKNPFAKVIKFFPFFLLGIHLPRPRPATSTARYCLANRRAILSHLR